MFFLNRPRQTISATSICRSEWLADQVLERIRERMTSVKDELKRANRFVILDFYSNLARKNLLHLLISD